MFSKKYFRVWFVQKNMCYCFYLFQIIYWFFFFLSYVSRVHVRDSAKHAILGTQQFKPKEFADQINLNMDNAWGILRCIIDTCMKLKEGKYLIMKDPNKVIFFPSKLFFLCILFWKYKVVFNFASLELGRLILLYSDCYALVYVILKYYQCVIFI